MNKRKISIILATATIASMSSMYIPNVTEQPVKNEVLLSRKNDINKSTSNNNLNKTNTNVALQEGSKKEAENNELIKNSISITGNWGGEYKIANIEFNPTNNKIEIDANMIAFFAQGTGKALKVSFYNSQGTVIKSDTYMKNDRVSDFYNDFNNLSFKYGDIIKITSLANDKVSISNFKGENNYIANKTITMEITKNGLKELGNDINVNKVYYSLNSNKVNVSGTTTTNTKVCVSVDNKVYTTISNNKGAFNLNINTDENITSSTNIGVYAEGEGFFETTPVLNPNIYGIIKNSITLLGNWNGGNYKTDVVSFNPITKKINISGSMTAYFGNFSGNAFKLGLYNKYGELIKSKIYGSSDQAQDLYNDFNNLGFQYGDIIQVTPLGPVKTKISNFDGENNYNTTKPMTMQIEQDGLKNLGNNINLNKIYYSLNSNKVDVSGTTVANTTVYINIDNKVYTTTSSSKGIFNLNINADKNIIATTNIEVYVEGENIVNVTPTLNPNVYGIIKNNITLLGNWYGGRYKAGTISFNPATMKLNISGTMGDYFASGSGKDFEISLYSKNGHLIKAKTYNNSSQTENLYNDFNDLGFSYGDIIKITPLGTIETSISNYNNKDNYITQSAIEMEITQNGLKECNMSTIIVNPFDVLGNGPVNSGVITGKTKKANEDVTINVGGKTFTGKSNLKGDFSVNILDSNGFTSTTNIEVSANDELTTIINPVAIANLGIEKNSILIHGEDGVIAQRISFNPATMTVGNSAPWGDSFSAQLLNGTTGKIMASCDTDSFNAFKSKNNLNGVRFKYGDIIAIYESEETNLSFGDPLFDNGKTTTKVAASGVFKCFKITQQGLIPVANKDLTSSKALYTGSKNVTITGKTLPNTKVTVYYSNESKVVKSNEKGEFVAEIPFNEVSIGSEVRVFVNNENIEMMRVNYDSSIFTINTNKIEILNNEGVPVFNIQFDPINNKLKAIAYPLSKTYAGAFYGNYLNVKVINPTTGNIIYNFSGNKLNDINSFISEINNKSYDINDIVEVSYNPNFVTANVYNNKDNIGNTTGNSEYFRITNKGLVNLNEKFIKVNPLDILGGGSVTNANIEGKVSSNSKVEVSVGKDIFKGVANANGDFNIAINCKTGFTSATNIVISSTGYIPTTINPTIESNIDLSNSYINLYNSAGWQGELVSSIRFNPETMKFNINNYSSSFGNGQSKYLNLSLYSSTGDKIIDSSINNGSTAQLTTLLNNRAFDYGDIIGLSYNNKISKPVVLNGNNAIGNISGQEEYFKITKGGLVSVTFGQNASTNNVYFDNNNLVINSTLASGQSQDTLNANKKLVILNSNNQVIESVNTSRLNENNGEIQGIIPEATLSKLNKGEVYEIALEINNRLYPIKVKSNITSSSKYLIEGNSHNQLTIKLANAKVINITNSSGISSYMNSINKNLNNTLNSNSNNVQDIINNSNSNNNVITSEFISTIGISNLEDFFNKSATNKRFINWVLNNKTAMEEFLNGPYPNGTYTEALQVWSNIWNTYSNSRSGFNLKLAIAVSLTNAKEQTAWPSRGTVGNQVQRYNIFETLNAEGGMLPIFDTLDVKHIGYVVDTHITNNQIAKMRAIIMQNHNGFINSGANGLNNIAYTINYNETNPHTGASVFGNNFYGPHPTIKDVWYDGGVCGSTSYMGVAGCQVFGIPANAVGQPGHCAFIFYNDNHTWTIGNNIDGWSLSNGGEISGWSKGIATNSNVVNYDLLYENADTKTLAKSNEYLWLAKSNISYNAKMIAINEAIKVQPLNLGAWLEKIKIMNSNKNVTVNEYLNLSNKIISTFKDYPMPMFDTLLQLKSEILLNGTQQEYNNFVDSITKALNSVTNSNQIATAKDMLTLMNQYGLIDNNSALSDSSIIINNAWGNALGTLKFLPYSNKIKVVKGWSRASAYIHGEVFSISLYSKNDKLIKDLQINGGDWPADSIYNTFNNLSFNYGDKIIIRYKASSAITVNNLKTTQGLEKEYKIKEPITTVYIENRGLTLVKPTSDLQRKNIINKKVLTKVNTTNKNKSSDNSINNINDTKNKVDIKKKNNDLKKPLQNNKKKAIVTIKSKWNSNKNKISTDSNTQRINNANLDNVFINKVDNLINIIKNWFDSWL